MYYTPVVIEQTTNGERSYDIYSRLLKDRIVMLNGEITDEVANSVVAQLLFLAAQDSKADINLYINSPGGSVTAGFAIYDTMRCLNNLCWYGCFYGSISIIKWCKRKEICIT